MERSIGERERANTSRPKEARKGVALAGRWMDGWMERRTAKLAGGALDERKTR